MKYDRWTPEEDALLAQNLSRAEMAELLPGRSIGAVKKRIERLRERNPNFARVRGREWTSDEDDLLLEFLAVGLNTREIASQLERSVAAVEGRIWKLRN